MTHKGLVKPQHNHTVAMCICMILLNSDFKSSPAEPRYALPLHTVYIQINWLLKPFDLDMHCLSLSRLILSKALSK